MQAVRPAHHAVRENGAQAFGLLVEDGGRVGLARQLLLVVALGYQVVGVIQRNAVDVQQHQLPAHGFGQHVGVLNGPAGRRVKPGENKEIEGHSEWELSEKKK